MCTCSSQESFASAQFELKGQIGKLTSSLENMKKESACLAVRLEERAVESFGLRAALSKEQTGAAGLQAQLQERERDFVDLRRSINDLQQQAEQNHRQDQEHIMALQQVRGRCRVPGWGGRDWRGRQGRVDHGKGGRMGGG